jgi:hypothetical protein
MFRRDLLALVAAAALIAASLTFCSRSAANERAESVACPESQTRRTPASKVPRYPRAESIGWQSVSLEGGGGGFGDIKASSDNPERVARWYACRIGPPESHGSSWSWHRRLESLDGLTSTVIEIKPSDAGDLPEFSDPVPEGARTVIEIHSFSVPPQER